MEKNHVEDARKLAEAYWGKDGPKGSTVKGVDSYVKEFKQIQSPDVMPILGPYNVFLAAVYNPASQVAGRVFRMHAIAINTVDASSVHYFEKDTEVAAFISQCKYALADQADVMNVIRLFEDMNGFQLAEEENTELISFVEIRNYGTEHESIEYSKDRWPSEDWQYTIQKEDNGWVVQVTFLDDPAIAAYRQYRFKLSADGEMNILEYKIAFQKGYR